MAELCGDRDGISSNTTDSSGLVYKAMEVVPEREDSTELGTIPAESNKKLSESG